MAGTGDRLVVGQTFPMTFSMSPSILAGGGLIAPSATSIRLVLGLWAPFSTTKLILEDVAVSGRQLVVTLKAGPGSEIFTFGGIGAAIADTLNKGYGGWNFKLTGVGVVAPSGAPEVPGTGATTFLQQFVQTPTPASGFSLALLGGAALLLLLVLKR